MVAAFEPLSLSFAVRTYGHTADVKSGEIPVKGVSPNWIEVKPQIAAYRRMVRELEFDVCELAPTTYIIARAYGVKFTALPIFVSRRFHHNGLLVRPDAGIEVPKDLEGKKVGVRAYSVTTGVWTRGVLVDEYGLDDHKVTWVVDDEEHVQALKLPDNVIHAPEGKSLASMMDSGEIQAGFEANAGIGREGKPDQNWSEKNLASTMEYRELLANADKLAADWYRRTGIYPMHGLVVVRDEVLKAHRWVAKSLYEAFLESKNRYVADLNAGKHTGKDDRKYLELARVVGSDPLPYGVAENRASIEALQRYAKHQGLIPNELPLSELFLDPTK
ncbi:ABC transporter substrate-binding protein [Rhizobium sp. 1AS11]|uniref:ABC transporter substrate-binding protein n=1 Tax=Rhizobium acaciae TaxID=2989736 RepID=UPI00222138F5|nr:ABC transporter substrate-binding protein [Rhizobium acaciae]MCW1411278.1 ABC transporter substrate-binding protein [Rhizobium acaciae]MCW1743310.1 ABC transporter substrate-binding protein [Rhizobium acaciae]